MRKHLLVICFVAVLLGGAYLVGRSTLSSSTPSNSASTPKAPAFNKHQYSLTDPTSPWVVVNKLRPLQPKDYVPPDLTAVGNGQLMRAQAAGALTQMLAAAQAAGYQVTPQSGYRSYDTQVVAYNSEVQGYGQAYADRESARPGYSEHQTGWAVDLGSDGCNIASCFGTTPGGKWVLANAYKYGFIQRYPADKSAITGYRDETWHFRYVGTALATYMHRQHIETLEEFFGLPPAPNY